MHGYQTYTPFGFVHPGTQTHAVSHDLSVSDPHMRECDTAKFTLFVHLRYKAADRPTSVGLRRMPAVQVSNMRINSQQQGAPFLAAETVWGAKFSTILQ